MALFAEKKARVTTKPTSAKGKKPVVAAKLPTTIYAPVKSSITTSQVMMTPELAQKLLDRNTRNRKIRQTRIERYARDMRAGIWLLNGSAIIVSSKKNLMDGQHRLLAVVQSGSSVPMTLTEGVDEAAFSSIDSGLTRTSGDVLGMRGITYSNQTAAAIRLILNYMDGLTYHTQRSNSEIEAAFDRHPEINDYVKSYNYANSQAPTSAAAVAYIAETFGTTETKALVASFREGMVTGANLNEGDPRLLLRNRLMSPGRRLDPISIWYHTQRSLDHHINGTTTTRLSTKQPSFSEIPTAPRAIVKAAW